ncbi:hypothetical protein [Fibrella arboris]|uniref:hypothetical protein n=1 Tax=Fibrella arboris TaxID=3242486 RepID=UPI003520FE48
MPRFIIPAIVLGAALVAFPFFFLRLALFALIIGGALRFIRRRAVGVGSGYQGRWGSPWQSRRLEFTDRIRTMSDAEYADFVQQNKPQRPIPIESFDRHSENFVL